MVARANDPQLAAYQMTVDAVIAALGSDIDQGLSRSEARARLTRDGPNALEGLELDARAALQTTRDNGRC